MRKFILLLIMAYISDMGLSEAQVFDAGFIKRQVPLDGNNISTRIQNSGTFNTDIRTNNQPGFMWPKGSNKFAIFATGLTIGGYVNGSLRLASASYSGEYQPGTIKFEGGRPTPYSDSTFKLYKISADDNAATNPDWANWGLMVPFGAPYIDVNINGQYDPQIDTPGVRYAAQTIFVCLTDGFPENHSSSEGFSGGTRPMNAEVRLTAWCYKIGQIEDVQYFKWEIINKNDAAWDKTHFGLVADPDLGNGTDDYIGCDTALNLGYTYNADSVDGNGNSPTYGFNPPAAGMRLLKSSLYPYSDTNIELGLTSFSFFTSTGAGGITCEQDPSQPIEAYNLLRALKKDGTPWLVPATFEPTKKVYTGDPETISGWSERGTDGNPRLAYVDNCGGSLTGNVGISPPGDRRFVMTSGADTLTVNPLDTQKVIMAQMVARGNNHLNAVTELKELSKTVERFSRFLYTDENRIVPESYTPPKNIPIRHYLEQNYPNPFNPVTEIKFGLAKSTDVNLTVYDMTGKEVSVLLNSEMNEGNYSIKFDGTGLPSGIYFYKFKAFGYIETKKMLLLK